jgi:chaperone modulatory protein CbpM
MNLKQVEWVWLDASDSLSLAELADCCGLSEPELEELVDYCALMPAPASPPPTTTLRVFSAGWITPLREVSKMRLDFDLDMFTVAIVLSKLGRIEALEREVRALQAQLGAHAPIIA